MIIIIPSTTSPHVFHSTLRVRPLEKQTAESFATAFRNDAGAEANEVSRRLDCAERFFFVRNSQFTAIASRTDQSESVRRVTGTPDDYSAKR